MLLGYENQDVYPMMIQTEDHRETPIPMTDFKPTDDINEIIESVQKSLKHSTENNSVENLKAAISQKRMESSDD